jgi:hypothetical protein
MNLRNLCLFMCVLGLFAVVSGNGGCGGGGGGGDTPVVTPPSPPPSPPQKPEPQGNWQDEGNYDMGWYSDKPYEISTAAELAGLAKLVNDGNTFEGETISLVGDIDLGDHYWTPICNHRFTVSFLGTFDGRGNTISNMTIQIKEINGYVEIGLFGKNDKTVANVHLTDVSISGANNELVYAGGLVGWNRGTVTGCTVTDSYISGSGYGCVVGGLVGANGLQWTEDRDGVITDCRVNNTTISSSIAVFSAHASAGALVGYVIGGGTIINCAASDSKVMATAPYDDGINLGSFIGWVTPTGGNISGNTTTITELPAIGRDDRLDPSGPSDDI